MRICIVNSASYVVVQRRAAALARLGHDVHVVSLVPGNIQGCQVHVVSIPRWMARAKLRFAYAAPLVYTCVRKIDAHVLDFQAASTHGLFSVLPFNRPIVVTLHGTDVYMHVREHAILRLAVRHVLKSADLVLASTPDIHQYILDFVGVDIRERLRTRHIGIPTARIVEQERERRETTRQAMGVGPGTRVVLHTRHIAKLWRVRVLMDAMKIVLAEFPKTELWLAFPPPNAEGAAILEGLRENARQLGDGLRVRFIGYRPYDELISLMHAADLYVCIGTHDLLCSSVLECLATRLIPIVSDVPAYRAVINDGQNGFVVVPVNERTLADRIVDVLGRHDAIQPGLGEYNRSLVVPEYDLDASIRWTLEQYEEAIDLFQRRK